MNLSFSGLIILLTQKEKVTEEIERERKGARKSEGMESLK